MLIIPIQELTQGLMEFIQAIKVKLLIPIIQAILTQDMQTAIRLMHMFLAFLRFQVFPINKTNLFLKLLKIHNLKIWSE